MHLEFITPQAGSPGRPSGLRCVETGEYIEDVDVELLAFTHQARNVDHRGPSGDIEYRLAYPTVTVSTLSIRSRVPGGFRIINDSAEGHHEESEYTPAARQLVNLMTPHRHMLSANGTLNTYFNRLLAFLNDPRGVRGEPEAQALLNRQNYAPPSLTAGMVEQSMGEAAPVERPPTTLENVSSAVREALQRFVGQPMPIVDRPTMDRELGRIDVRVAVPPLINDIQVRLDVPAGEAGGEAPPPVTAYPDSRFDSWAGEVLSESIALGTALGLGAAGGLVPVSDIIGAVPILAMATLETTRTRVSGFHDIRRAHNVPLLDFLRYVVHGNYPPGLVPLPSALGGIRRSLQDAGMLRTIMPPVDASAAGQAQSVLSAGVLDHGVLRRLNEGNPASLASQAAANYNRSRLREAQGQLRGAIRGLGSGPNRGGDAFPTQSTTDPMTNHQRPATIQKMPARILAPPTEDSIEVSHDDIIETLTAPPNRPDPPHLDPKAGCGPYSSDDIDAIAQIILENDASGIRQSMVRIIKAEPNLPLLWPTVAGRIQKLHSMAEGKKLALDENFANDSAAQLTLMTQNNPASARRIEDPKKYVAPEALVDVAS